jgi:hypothetical protein
MCLNNHNNHNRILQKQKMSFLKRNILILKATQMIILLNKNGSSLLFLNIKFYEKF